MVDEQHPPLENGAGGAPTAKKVVKRVVKKSVVRPGTAPPPTVRYGRPVTGTTPKAKVGAPSGKTSAKQAQPSKAPPRAKPEIGAKVGAATKVIASRGAGAASGVAGAARSVGQSIGDASSRGFGTIRDWRIPQWAPLPAALFTGAFVGLLSVGLSVAALAGFSEVRGVSGGGGRWGSLTFVVVAFIAFVVGELLLSAFGSSQPRLVSFLGVILTIVAMLGLFLQLADSGWALLLIPALGAVAYAIARWLLDLAESSPTLPERPQPERQRSSGNPRLAEPLVSNNSCAGSRPNVS